MANIFGMRQMYIIIEGCRKLRGSPMLSRNFINFGPKTAQMGTVILPICILRIFYILLHCQASDTEVSEQNSTKLCDMLGSESDLQMHIKFEGLAPKLGSWNCLFCDGSHLDKTMPDTAIAKEFLPTFRKRSPWLRCDRNKAIAHIECKWHHQTKSLVSRGPKILSSQWHHVGRP